MREVALKLVVMTISPVLTTGMRLVVYLYPDC